MNKTTSSILAAAVSGLLLGCSGEATSGAGEDTRGATSTMPSSGNTGAANPALAIADKHACKGLNSCKNNGGCRTGDAGCAGKNTCKAKGGCATVAHHSCAGKNGCKELGGCGSGDNGCKAKNSCEGKGGCAVPITH